MLSFIGNYFVYVLDSILLEYITRVVMTTRSFYSQLWLDVSCVLGRQVKGLDMEFFVALAKGFLLGSIVIMTMLLLDRLQTKRLHAADVATKFQIIQAARQSKKSLKKDGNYDSLRVNRKQSSSTAAKKPNTNLQNSNRTSLAERNQAQVVKSEQAQ